MHKKLLGLNKKEPAMDLPGALNVLLCMPPILPALEGIRVICDLLWAPSMCLDISFWLEHKQIPGDFFLIQKNIANAPKI